MLDFTDTGIEYPYKKPVTLTQMKKLVKQNKKILEGLQINIFGWYCSKVYAFELGIGKKMECKF